MKAKQPKHTSIHRIYYDPSDLSKFIPVKCKLAKTTVKLLREDADVWNGKAGSTKACMNANCAKRLAPLFPHPVYFVEFWATTVFIVTKLTKGGQPLECIKYRHNDRNGIGMHDKLGPSAIRESGRAKKIIILSPPKSQIGWKKAPGAPSRIHTQRNAPHVRPIPHGAKKRAQDAGLFVMDSV